MSRKARLEGKRFLAYKAHVLLWGLLMRPLMCREIIPGSESLPAVALVIPLLQMNRIDVHLHMGALSKISPAILARPLFLPSMRGSDMPLQ